MTTSCTFSIELLPEFGWSVKGIPVYGPGSVFQGMLDTIAMMKLILNHQVNPKAS